MKIQHLVTVLLMCLLLTVSGAEDLKEIVKRAERGDAEAQFDLAKIYSLGKGVKIDPVNAVKWYRKSAEQGFAKAQCNLGVMYSEGIGVEKDPVEAVKWYRKSAEQGLAIAQSNLGAMYAKGVGVSQDSDEALKWIYKAIDQGEVQAQLTLAKLYYTGEGVVKNELESLAWLYVAKANGGDAQTGISHIELSNGKAFSLLAQKRALEIKDELEKKKGSYKAKNKAPQEANNNALKATGTGAFIASDGLILTAAHVIEMASSIKVRTVDGVLPASLVSIDRNNDVALLKVEHEGNALPVKTSRSVKLGQKVFTLGFPNVELQGSNLKMTEGSISSLGGIQDDPRQWQISVPVQPGNSGGPLFDEQGNVIGVVVSKLDAIKTAKYTGDLPQNVNYAVKSAYFLPLLEPHEAKLVPESQPGQIKPEAIVEKVQDSVVLILVY